MRSLLLWCVLCVAACTACTSDLDCSLNGLCSSNQCICDAPWKGAQCETLSRLPRPVSAGQAAYGHTPNVTSWGGGIVRDDNGTYHLYVAEMADDVGSFCGLRTWTTHSRVAHAVSTSPLGPFQKVDVALPQEAHNPSIVRGKDGAYYLFHIGDASGAKVCNCTEPAFLEEWNEKNLANGSESSFLHRSASPYGPWMPLPSLRCNNPAPLALSNGSFLVGCNDGGFRVYRSDNVAQGDWTLVTIMQFPASWGGPGSPDAKYLRAEDPFLFQDRRGNFHFLSHNYDYRDGWPPNPNQTMPVLVSGHGFSTNAIDWHFSSSPPYPSTVSFSDGTTRQFSTMERPHLVFDSDGTPTHLVNGVSPTWGEPTPCSQCDARPGTQHSCVVCKTSAGVDWTYTMTQQLDTKQQPPLL